MAFSLGEYQDIFLEEADEQLQELNQNLLELEKNPENLEIINNIFRAAHSLKSSAAFVGLNELSDLAHMMENLLQGIRDGGMGVTPEIIDIIFKCFDEIHNVIDTIASGDKPEQDLQWLIDDIQAICENTSKTKKPKKQAAAAAAPRARKEPGIPQTMLDGELRRRIRDGIDGGNSCYEVTVYIEDKAQMKWVKAQLVVSNLGKISEIVVTFPSVEDLNDDEMNNVFKMVILTGPTVENVWRSANLDLIYRIDVRPIAIVQKRRQGRPPVRRVQDLFTATLSREGANMSPRRSRPPSPMMTISPWTTSTWTLSRKKRTRHLTSTGSRSAGKNPTGEKEVIGAQDRKGIHRQA